MNEKLLQFIWQFQYFNKNQLTTADGASLAILFPGNPNMNQGPDFSGAKIKLDETTWIGNVEIHIRASHWHAHHHSYDPNYNNVILHVVWINDACIKDGNAQVIATLELQSIVPKLMLQQYEQLMQAKDFIACKTYLPVLSDLGWTAWKERLVAERLQHRATSIFTQLTRAKDHWEEVFWWMLAKNLGMKINASAFEQTAMTLPVNILAKHKNQVNQLEALLLGQAGMISGEFKEEYPLLLDREYKFLSKKYKLVPINKAPVFLRMRPANFPTIRLAQLAMIVNQSSHLFSRILEANNIDNLRSLLNVTANDYWHYHYRFDEATAYKPKKLGGEMTDNIIINTIVPVLFAYGLHHKIQQWKERAIQFLLQLPSEENAIINAWKLHGVFGDNAFGSQALIELKNNYCERKSCLNCAVGNKLLRN